MDLAHPDTGCGLWDSEDDFANCEVVSASG
jgi:hypothetical protein